MSVDGSLRQGDWRRQALLIGSLTAFALCLRLPGLGDSFYGDEGFSVLRDSSHLLTPTEDRFRPVFFSLLYLWRRLGFHGEIGLRLLPVLFGVLQIPVAFFVGAISGGTATATLFALLLAASPALIEFSQELRMYSLVPLIALLQAWALLCAARGVERGGAPPRRAWLAFVAAGTAGIYTHFHFWFSIAGFAFALLRRGGRLLRQGLWALGLIVALYLPNVPNLLRFGREGAGAPHLMATDAVGALPKLLAAYLLGFNYFRLPRLGIERSLSVGVLASNLALTAVAAVPLAIVGWQLARMHVQRRVVPAAWLSHELFAIPIVLSFLCTVALRRDFVHPKYMVATAPFLMLLVTAAAQEIRFASLRWSAGIASTVAFAISLVHFSQPDRYGRREDWRGATRYLRSTVDDESALLLLGKVGSPERLERKEPPETLWDYYGGDLDPRVVVMSLPRDGATLAEVEPTFARLTGSKRRVYYVWSEITANVSDPRDWVLAAARARLGDEQRVQLNPRLILYRWSAKSDPGR